MATDFGITSGYISFERLTPPVVRTSGAIDLCMFYPSIAYCILDLFCIIVHDAYWSWVLAANKNSEKIEVH